MIRPTAPAALLQLTAVARTSLVASERDLELPALQPGQPIDARVERQLRSAYIVSMLGQRIELKLPEGVRPGDLLRLVYVKDSPAPTFALLRIEQARDPVPLQLSDAGKLLGMLQATAADEAGLPARAATAPLFQSRVPETAQAATLLREALGCSGLFYESHQAQWVLGMRSTEQLRREPQGQLAPMQPGPDQFAQSSAGAAHEPSGPGAGALPEEATRGSVADTTTQGEPGARLPAHPDTFPILRGQLSALECGHVAWQGQVWPGQYMQWQVSDDESRAPGPGTVPRTWRTSLKLTLPGIGAVHARIALDESGAKLEIIADSAPALSQLREQAPALALGLQTSGIPVKAIEFRHGSEAV